MRPMMPGALQQHRALLKTTITDKVAQLADGRTFDGVSDLAKHLPLAAISFLVGLAEDGRQNMLRWAAAVFNMVGPYAPEIEEDSRTLAEFRAYLLSVDPAMLRPGSWAMSLFDAARDGKLTLPQARAALSGLVAPSLDTTINAKSSLLHNLATHPDQWRRLRADPSLVPRAVVETVRHSAVVRWFARVAAEEYRAGDVFVPGGTRVMIMHGAANRDERRYPDPDAFDILRDSQDQLGWGTGPHVCTGLHLARMEMEVLLEALVENVAELEAASPVPGANRGLYGFDALPMRMTSGRSR